MVSLPKPQNDEERLRYKGWLTDARQAYHDLVSGSRARVFVDQNGERLEYDRASSSDLAKWIAILENALDLNLAAFRQPRPLGFTF